MRSMVEGHAARKPSVSSLVDPPPQSASPTAPPQAGEHRTAPNSTPFLARLALARFEEEAICKAPREAYAEAARKALLGEAREKGLLLTWGPEP